jgi:PAS domain S-box-containing protein
VLTGPAPPEALVRERAETLLRHLRNVPVAILVANNRARYVDVNRLAVPLTGYSRAELLQMTLWDVTPLPRRDLALRLWRAFLRRRRMAGRFVLRRKDGTFVGVHYTAVAHVLPGVHVSALVPDVAATGRRPSRRGQTRVVPRK